MVTRLVKAAMVEKTYRWQNYDVDDTQYYETKIAGQVTPENSSDESNNEQKFLQEELKAAEKLKSRAKKLSNFENNSKLAASQIL